MKSIYFFGLVLLAVFGLGVSSNHAAAKPIQEELSLKGPVKLFFGEGDFKRNPVLTLYPLAFVGNTLRLGYEMPLSSNFSLKVIPGLTTVGSRELYAAQGRKLGFSGELQGRTYFTGNQPSALHLFGALTLEYRYQVWRDPIYASKREFRSTYQGAGLLCGLQIHPTRHFAIDFYLGGIFQRVQGDSEFVQTKTLETWKPGINPKFGLNAGWVF